MERDMPTKAIGTGTQNRYGLLLLLLVASFLVKGIENSRSIRLVDSVIVFGTLVVALSGIHDQRRRLRMLALIPLSVVGIVLVGSLSVDHLGGAIGATVQAIVLSVITLVVLHDVFRHERVTEQTLLGAVSAYFLIGQVFAWIYLALPGYLDEQVLVPSEGTGIPDYYSYVVLTTLGFGDVTPVGAFAQRVTVVEALIGQLFLGVLVARLVALYSRDKPESVDPVEAG
jgi:hypothetical protein